MERHYQIHIGDCLETLRTLPDNSVDSIVTDPPYGLSKEPDMAEVLRHWLAGDDYQHKGGGFMGKTWDSFVPGPSIWRECLRVLKPGGHLLAFFGTRTQDMGTLAIRLAGFEIRDSISWVYGSGFPKSMDVSKAIDKAEDYKLQAAHRRAWVEAVQEAGLSLPGNSRHDWTVGEHAPGNKWWAEFEAWLPGLSGEKREAIERIVVGKGFKPRPTFHTADIGGEAEANEYAITTAATDAARQWEGWGTALKPALEPITVARKPLVGNVAANVLAHGTGALNIDGCRVHSHDSEGYAHTVQRMAPGADQNKTGKTHQEGVTFEGHTKDGRWPANLIHDGSDEVVELLGEAARFFKQIEVTDEEWLKACEQSSARFMYCAKASRKDRNEGLQDPGPQFKHGTTLRQVENTATAGNNHPTVKPTDLMAYLCRLVTPPGGTVLDPFMGSGSTGKAAVREGFRFIGCELSPEYCDIARARLFIAVCEASGL